MTREEAAEKINWLYYEADYGNNLPDDMETAVDMAIEALKQPEIIRCKDCHYYDGERCDMHKMMTDQTDYCSYAVGKYGEDET